MVAVTLPLFVQRFFDWVELNPALGAVVILLGVVFALWLLRKSLKFFMVALILLGVTILGSYYFYGSARTNDAVKRGSQEVYDFGKELLEEGLRGMDQAESGGDGGHPTTEPEPVAVPNSGVEPGSKSDGDGHI